MSHARNRTLDARHDDHLLRRTARAGDGVLPGIDDAPDVVVDFDNDGLTADGLRVLSSVYGPMRGTVGERAAAITGDALDGRWLLVAQHLACWRVLWAPERAAELPSLGLLLTRLLEAETLLASYA